MSGRRSAGILWMLVTTFFFVCVHATGKLLLQTYPIGQVVWGRYVFHLLLVVLILGPRIVRFARSHDLKTQLFRSSLMFGATILYFAGVRLLPLAEANAINFLTPILVVLLARPVLGETVGFKRWIGVGLGCFGALIIIRPGSGAMDVAALFLIGASLCNAGYQLTTRKLGSVDDPLTTLLYTALIGSIGSSLVLPLSWTPMDLHGWILMALVGLLALIGHFAMIKAYKTADAATIAPFNYTTLLWSAMFGLFLFNDVPDLWTIIGAAIVMASGVAIARADRTRQSPLRQ